MILGLTRIRNEAEIINDTLDHMSTFCDKVIVYDDCSTDNTVELCNSHPIVHHVIQGESWDSNRAVAEFENRHQLWLAANVILDPNDWFVYMDADEVLEFDWTTLNDNLDAVRMRLYDFYITEEDKDKHYLEREWMGPEYRDILFAFRMGATTGWHGLDQRECSLWNNPFQPLRIQTSGYVKHFGKAVSIQQWEDTCEYYATHFPMYSEKWNARRGKAIHTKSDFGRELIRWEDRHTKGIRL
jgi:glycosyltransferase involved in cell wall biosynthesis